MNNNRLGKIRRFIYAFTGMSLLLLAGVLFYVHNDSEPQRSPLGESLSRVASSSPHSPLIKIAVPAQQADGGNRATPYGPGMDWELLEMFFARGNYRVKLVYAQSYDEAMRLLQRQGADLMVGFGAAGELPGDGKIARSPALTEFNPIMIVLPEGELNGLDPGNVHFNKVCYSATQLEDVKEHGDRAMLVDPAIYAILMPLHTNIKTAGIIAEKSGYYWFWNSNNKKLDAEMRAFWADSGIELALNLLEERYYGFMPQNPRQHSFTEINSAVSGNIGRYGKDIARAAARHEIDPLLLSAVIFQESRFNPNARSYTGVRGIMQLTLPTADMLGVDRLNPEDAIMGGALYLRTIYDSIEAENISEWDKWCLTLAGFNQGPTIMRRAVRAAQADGRGLDWQSMREFYPGLRAKGLAGSEFRPREAVDYVENVRYYYYVLSGLASVGRPEHQNLAGLFVVSN